MLRFDCRTGSLEQLLPIAGEFHQQGVMVLEGAFEVPFVDSLAEHYLGFYHPRIRDPDYPYQVAPLGSGRTHVTLELHKAWHDPRFYANRWLYPFLRHILGEGFAMPTFAISVSEPGAGPQYIHRDQPWLFEDPVLNQHLPACSITISVPLVDADEDTGSTEFQPGSHHPRDAAGMAEREPIEGIDFVPALARRGDCILWDSRLVHRGMPNRSQRTRPIVLMYCQKPWFFNYENFGSGVALPFTQEAWDRVAEQHRHLFELVHRLFPRQEFRAGEGDSCPCGSRLPYQDCHGDSP